MENANKSIVLIKILKNIKSCINGRFGRFDVQSINNFVHKNITDELIIKEIVGSAKSPENWISIACELAVEDNDKYIRELGAEVAQKAAEMGIILDHPLIRKGIKTQNTKPNLSEKKTGFVQSSINWILGRNENNENRPKTDLMPELTEDNNYNEPTENQDGYEWDFEDENQAINYNYKDPERGIASSTMLKVPTSDGFGHVKNIPKLKPNDIISAKKTIFDQINEEMAESKANKERNLLYNNNFIDKYNLNNFPHPETVKYHVNPNYGPQRPMTPEIPCLNKYRGEFEDLNIHGPSRNDLRNDKLAPNLLNHNGQNIPKSTHFDPLMTQYRQPTAQNLYPPDQYASYSTENPPRFPSAPPQQPYPFQSHLPRPNYIYKEPEPTMKDVLNVLTLSQRRNTPQISIETLKEPNQGINKWFKRFESLTKTWTEEERGLLVSSHFDDTILNKYELMQKDTENYQEIKKHIIKAFEQDTMESHQEFFSARQRPDEDVEAFGRRLLKIIGEAPSDLKSNFNKLLPRVFKKNCCSEWNYLLVLSAKTDFESILKEAKELEKRFLEKTNTSYQNEMSFMAMSTESVCYACKKHGHFARECPNSLKCSWCEGTHSSNECSIMKKFCTKFMSMTTEDDKTSTKNTRSSSPNRGGQFSSIRGGSPARDMKVGRGNMSPRLDKRRNSQILDTKNVARPTQNYYRPKCSYCQGIGHSEQFCRLKLGQCLRCGEASHQMRNCPLNLN